MEIKEPKQRKRRRKKNYGLATKLLVIEDFNTNPRSQKLLSEKYGIPLPTLNAWISKYANDKLEAIHKKHEQKDEN